MGEYVHSSREAPTTAGSVSIFSRGSYHFLRTAKSGPYSSTKSRRRTRKTVSLPILLGTKPAKFKVAPQYFEVKPLLMINSRLPDKKIDLPIANKKDDNWRTDDIYMNMLHLKLEKRRQHKLDQMSYIMKDLKEQMDDSKASTSERVSVSSKSHNSSSVRTYLTPLRQSTTDTFPTSAYTLPREPATDNFTTTSKFTIASNYSIPSGLQPQYHISSPKFRGIHPWSKTASAHFLPQYTASKPHNDINKEEAPFTPGFVNGRENRLGAFYTRRGRKKTPLGEMRPVITPIKRGNRGPTLTEDEADKKVPSNTLFTTSVDANSNNIKVNEIEMRPLKSGKAGLFSGDDQILPIDDSRVIDSWKWGMQ